MFKYSLLERLISLTWSNIWDSNDVSFELRMFGNPVEQWGRYLGAGIPLSINICNVSVNVN